VLYTICIKPIHAKNVITVAIKSSNLLSFLGFLVSLTEILFIILQLQGGESVYVQLLLRELLVFDLALGVTVMYIIILQ
jgi:predicted transcriptional regulator